MCLFAGGGGSLLGVVVLLDLTVASCSSAVLLSLCVGMLRCWLMVSDSHVNGASFDALV